MAQPDRSRRLQVLVVEDELLIAMDVEMLLDLNGHEVLGPASTIDAALRLMEDTRPDVALLDANLGGRSVVPLARRLRDMEIPFVMASAYASFDFDGGELLSGVENVGKPISERRLLAALERAAPACRD